MATRTASLAPDNGTDASFRLWINEIHNALIAFGWLQTGDTGQINFSTVTRPVAINTYQGFAIYKMNDSLQSTCAVFMRIDFGTCATTNVAGIKVRVGIGSTDGAGNLTGNLMNTVTTTTSAVGSVSTFNCRTSGNASSFRMHFWSTSLAGHGWTFVVERDKDTSGAETGLGVNIALEYPTSGTTGFAIMSQFLETAGGVGFVAPNWVAFVSSQPSQSGGGNIGVGPVRCPLGPFRNPMIGLLLFARLDMAMESTNPVTIYGTSHTYLMLRPNLGGVVAANTWNPDCGMAILWE